MEPVPRGQEGLILDPKLQIHVKAIRIERYWLDRMRLSIYCISIMLICDVVQYRLHRSRRTCKKNLYLVIQTTITSLRTHTQSGASLAEASK